MSTKNSRDKHGKHKKNPQAVRNQRVIVFTFVIILALMYQSSHWKLEKERLTETIAQLESLETEAMAPVEENRGEDGDGPAEEETSEGVSDLPEEENVPEGDDSLMEESMEESAEEGEKTSDGDSSAGDEAGETSDGLVIREEDMWCLILTNARYPVPDDYEVELAQLPGSNQSVDARIYEPLVNMFDAMKAEGLKPVVCSGYRTLDKQEKLFNRKVQSYVRSGYSMEDANNMARQVLSIPGSGEHCLGLAVDIYASSYKALEIGFENTKEGKWLREHSQDYGFTLRYDRGKEEVTGIQYEPWHFRYVGVDVARYLKDNQLSLEEFYIEQSLYG